MKDDAKKLDTKKKKPAKKVSSKELKSQKIEPNIVEKPRYIEGHKILSIEKLEGGRRRIKAENGCEYTIPDSEFDILVK